nr:hypothetical protein [Pseudomonas migulae]
MLGGHPDPPRRLYRQQAGSYRDRIVQDLLGPWSLVFGFSPLFTVLVPAGVFLLRRAG